MLRLTLARWRDLFWQIDFLFSLAAGVVIAWRAPAPLLSARFVDALSVGAGLATTILGLGLAGLALVVAFLDPRILTVMDRTDGGLYEDVWPFWFTSLQAAVTSGIAVTALIVVPRADNLWMRISLAAFTFLFFWTMSSVLGLVQQVVEYGRVRATFESNQHSGASDADSTR